MTGLELGGLLILVLFGAILLGMPVAVAMLVVGGIGFAELSSWTALLRFLGTMPHGRVSSYSLSVIPLFILMGELALRAGFSQSLFNAANAWLGHRRGGLAMATIGACAGFGAICGSSVATVATMSRVVLPEMERFGYAPRLSTGALAAGGTLGILIPPSVILVIYAIIIEESIGRLFLAALGPGILATLLYMLVIAVIVRLRPGSGPAGERHRWRARIASLGGVLPVAVIFGVVVGGIYLGFFTPTEAAAIGTVAIAALAFGLGRLSLRDFVDSVLHTGRTTGMAFLILIGAEVYNGFLARTRLPFELADLVGALAVPDLLIMVMILVVYLLLGCIMDTLSMILLTVPVFYPVVLGLDLGMTPDQVSVWFGIVVLMTAEIGLITPPFGLNVFIINNMAPQVPLTTIFGGVLPFAAVDILRVGLIVFFPILCLWPAGLW